MNKLFKEAVANKDLFRICRVAMEDVLLNKVMQH